MGASKESLLKLYCSYDKHSGSKGDIFGIVLICSILIFAAVGVFLMINKPASESIEEKIAKIHTRFIIEDKKPVKRVVPKPEPPKKERQQKKEKEPLDLTKKPVLAQKQNDITEPPPKDSPVKKTVRRVYGLRKVYSTGIGGSGDNSNAVIGKLGNTLATEPDTFKATDEELAGEVQVYNIYYKAAGFKGACQTRIYKGDDREAD